MPGPRGPALSFILVAGLSVTEDYLSDLGPIDPLVLAVIIGATSTLWAIGFAAYAFIFNYLHQWVSAMEQRGTLQPLSPEAERSLRDNRRVFMGFIVQGVLSLATISMAGEGFYTHDPGWVPRAGVGFVLTILTFFVLFVNDIRSSIRFVNRRLHPEE